MGDESLATAEKGRAMVAAIATHLVDFVAELRGRAVEVRTPGIVA